MPESRSTQSSIPQDFTSFELSLVQKTETALEEGLALERWTRDPNRRVEFHPLNLNRHYKLPNQARGYFGEVTIGARTLTALGARQEVEFGRITAPNPGQFLTNYVLSDFLNTAHWVYPGGRPGGFTFRKMLYCDANGQFGRYPESELPEVENWRDIGPRLRWSLFTCYLHDFVLKIGPINKVLPEAVALVQHSDFIHIVERPRPGVKLEVAVGCPFIDYAPIPNHFGFGPGKFNWAVKTYSFQLKDNNDVACVMDFVAGARPRKVFDFGKRIPDPIYGTADALGTLTRGFFNARRFHDYVDLQMATQHARVHQSLMEGTAKVFARMQPK